MVADKYTYSEDWWTDGPDSEAKIRIVLDEGKLGRLAYRALNNPSGKAQMGPFTATVVQRRKNDDQE